VVNAVDRGQLKAIRTLRGIRLIDERDAEAWLRERGQLGASASLLSR